MNKKALSPLWTDLISLSVLLVIFIGVLYHTRIYLMIWNFILQRPDQATQDKFDRLITEINSLDNGDSKPIPVGVNKEEPFKYTLKSMRQCKKGEDSSSDFCTKQESKLCLLDKEKENARPFCKDIDNGHFKETEELGVNAEGNVIIAKDDKGFITIEDAVS